MGTISDYKIILKTLGYYTGPIDSHWDEEARIALMNFSFEFNLPNTADLNTEAKLKLEEIYSIYPQGNDLSHANGVTMALQKKLVDLSNKLQINDYKIVVDGFHGPITTAAMNRFQKNYGLMETPLFDRATIEKLDLNLGVKNEIEVHQRFLENQGYQYYIKSDEAVIVDEERVNIVQSLLNNVYAVTGVISKFLELFNIVKDKMASEVVVVEESKQTEEIVELKFYYEPIIDVYEKYCDEKVENVDDLMPLGAYDPLQAKHFIPDKDMLSMYLDRLGRPFEKPIKNYLFDSEGRFVNNSDPLHPIPARPSRTLYGWRNQDYDKTTFSGERYYTKNLNIGIPRTDHVTWHNGIDLGCPEGTEIYAVADCITYNSELNDGTKIVYALLLEQEMFGLDPIVSNGKKYLEVCDDSVELQNWIDNINIKIEDIIYTSKNYALVAYLHVMDDGRPSEKTFFKRGESIKVKDFATGITSNTGMKEGENYHLHFELYIPNSQYRLQYDYSLMDSVKRGELRVYNRVYNSVNPWRYFDF